MAKRRAKSIAHKICSLVSDAFGATWPIHARWVGVAARGDNDPVRTNTTVVSGDDDDGYDHAEAFGKGKAAIVDSTDLTDTTVEEIDAALLDGYAVAVRLRLGDEWYSVSALSTSPSGTVYSLIDALERLSNKYGEVAEGGFATTYSDEDEEEQTGYLISGVSVYVKAVS